jgi:hypothetical protein
LSGSGWFICRYGCKVVKREAVMLLALETTMNQKVNCQFRMGIMRLDLAEQRGLKGPRLNRPLSMLPKGHPTTDHFGHTVAKLVFVEITTLKTAWKVWLPL